nr:SpaH/EbpB family LPXTG-anchored major pilin [uncultured Blautia sp.]
MKKMKKIASLLLALVMVLGMAVSTSAATETGSITIRDNSNSTVSVAGKTFNAYKILDVKSYTAGKGEEKGTVVYTVPTELKTFFQTRYNLTGNEGDFDAKVTEEISKEPDMFAFATAVLNAAKEANITPRTATAGEKAASVTIDNLPLGYYVVEDTGAATPVSALILDTTNPSVDIKIKADKPGIDKNIDGTKDTDDATTGDVKYNNAAVGDMVPYKLTSKVPDMTGYKKYYFVVNDTLSKGLTFNNDVTITVGNDTKEKNTDYTVTQTKNTDGTTSVEIVFKNFIQYATNPGADITITYSATVNENAVIGVEGNSNKVKLIYSNNPNIDESGNQEDKPGDQSPTGKTPDVETRTYVTDLELIKVDQDGVRLTGAEFQITGTKLNTVLVRKDVYTEDENGTYWKLKDGSYTTDDPGSEGMDESKYESTTTKYSKSVETEPIEKAENVNYTATVGTDGVLRFEGLSAGTYIITEIKAPAGYNLLTTPIEVTIGFTAPTAPSTDCTWTYTGTDAVNETNTNQIIVVNRAGTELPSTGGIGTTIFYVIGGVLVAAAGVLLIVKKRMSKEM